MSQLGVFLENVTMKIPPYRVVKNVGLVAIAILLASVSMMLSSALLTTLVMLFEGAGPVE